MDERFRRKGIWIAVGAVAIIFLCVMLCWLGAMVTTVMRSGPTYGGVPQGQPPAGEAGVTPPQVYHSPLGGGGVVGGGPFAFLSFGIGLLFKLLLLGLFLLLLIGLVKRIFWGPRHWHPHHWGKPPAGEEWKVRPHGSGPWPWHWHGERWSTEGEPSSQGSKPEDAESAYGGAE